EIPFGDQPSIHNASTPTRAPLKMSTIRRIHSSPGLPPQNFDGMSTAQHTATVMKKSVPIVFQLSVKRKAASSVVVIAAKRADMAREPESSAILSLSVKAGSATAITGSVLTGVTTGMADFGGTGISFALPTGRIIGRGAGVFTGIATGTS